MIESAYLARILYPVLLLLHLPCYYSVWDSWREILDKHYQHSLNAATTANNGERMIHTKRARMYVGITWYTQSFSIARNSSPVLASAKTRWLTAWTQRRNVLWIKMIFPFMVADALILKTILFMIIAFVISAMVKLCHFQPPAWRHKERTKREKLTPQLIQI